MKKKANPTVPGWWERETRRRQQRLLIFLLSVLALVSLFYWRSSLGEVGIVSGIDFSTSDFIAFVRAGDKGQTDLYAIRADGTGLRRLTPADDTSMKASPAWTLDGRSVVYSSDLDANKVSQLYILGSAQPRQLTYGTGNKESPAASADRTTFSFITQGLVKSVQLNGKYLLQVLPPPLGPDASSGDAAEAQGNLLPTGPFLSAEFAPDGRSIAGVQDISNDPATADAGGSQLADQAMMVSVPYLAKPLLLDTGHEVSFAWDAAGGKLACSFTELVMAPEGGRQELRSGIDIWTFSGTAKPTATALLVAEGYSIESKHVAWSPDGSRLAFEVWRLKGPGDRQPRGIYVMQVNQGGVLFNSKNADLLKCTIPQTLAGTPENPKWSPDSTRILYDVPGKDGRRDLYVINAEGTSPISLTKGIADNYDAAWSPVK